ncbi:1-acyl-sn-glycerol-3-phosphate acyltransferase [Saccharomonospora piscinae]|uniref:lysophospholipid acyltransferase family protein n=1 Tax=Saccharomonospora piscinae TaxID=687388 RepID=UPI0011064FE5|nr:lysophospholipid acyltransferase family protein [Saccharomonospora piscinae]TLW89646.1 1-acyl-sn-glycerol-3-phosphate acyltransferase [Saccharomonospora piscinae]
MLQLLIRRGLAPLARLVYRPEVTGLDNVPADGPVVLAPNHRSAIDTAVIALTSPRPVRFLGKAEYFTGGGLKGKVVASFLSALGYVPVERGNAQAGLAALGAARAVLERGETFAIYPEGTRSLDGRLYRGHTGVGSLALETGAAVVPVALSGTERLLPVGRRIPRPGPVHVRFGPPLDFTRYQGLGSSPAIRRAVTDEIMYSIMELSGQEYVDHYHRRPRPDAA